MSRHVYVVASGFGCRVVPRRAPYRFATSSGDALLVEVAAEDAWRSGTVEPQHGASQALPGDVADLQPGPTWGAWWLETSNFRLPLPSGWTAHASGEDGPIAFDLVSAGGGLVYVQMPRELPPLESLVSPGQRVVRRWSDSLGGWLDVTYEQDGKQWTQRHCVRSVGRSASILTGQAIEGAQAETLECLTAVVAAIEPQSRHHS